MRAGGLWRLFNSTPMRLSFALVALFAVVSLISLGAAYVLARDAAEATLRETLEQEMQAFRATPNRAALIALVRSQSQAVAPERKIVSYRLPGGLVVGNAALIADDEGYRAVSIRDRGALTGSYYALAESVHGGLLTVAINADRIDGVREAFVTVFFVSLVPTALILLGGGVWLARRSERRLARIEAVLDALAAGDYSQRVDPPPGRNDDLTRIARRIDRMAEAQARQIGALRQVSADIAHDLKTPIQRVRVLLERLAERPGADELATEALRETEQMGRIFEALLQLARLESGEPGQGKAMESLRLDALVETLVEVFEPVAEEGERRLAPGSLEPVEITGDRTLLAQAITNLIENALRHTPPGARVEVACGGAGAEAWVEVSDDGPGIPAEERQNVTRRLYRLERSRTTPGSGLGLALVSAIAELHGGRLELADNAPGLRARLVLPRAPATGGRAAAPHPER